MTATAFDTLSAARDLEAAGFERRQAEALAGAVRQASAADREALATKADLADHESRLVSTLATKAELRAVQWVVGIQSAITLAAITLATFAIVAAKLL